MRRFSVLLLCIAGILLAASAVWADNGTPAGVTSEVVTSARQPSDANAGDAVAKAIQEALFATRKQGEVAATGCDIPPECGCCGDLAGSDGVIGFNDLTVLAWHLGRHASDPEWDPCVDMSGDGVYIDANDLGVMAVLLQQQCCPTAGSR